MKTLLTCLLLALVAPALLLADNSPIDAATKERSLKNLAAAIADTEGILRRLDYERDRMVQNFTQSQKDFTERENDIRNRLHGARLRLPNEKDKEQRALLIASIKQLENEDYPALQREIAAVDKSRIEWNSRSAERAQFKERYVKQLADLRAQEATLRARPVANSASNTGNQNTNSSNSGGGNSPDTSRNRTKNTTIHSTGNKHADMWNNILSLEPEARKRLLENMLQTIEKHEQNIEKKEQAIKTARAELLRINAMRPFDKIRYDGEVMEVREASKRLSDSIAKVVGQVVKDRAFFAGERARAQIELAKIK